MVRFYGSRFRQQNGFVFYNFTQYAHAVGGKNVDCRFAYVHSGAQVKIPVHLRDIVVFHFHKSLVMGIGNVFRKTSETLHYKVVWKKQFNFAEHFRSPTFGHIQRCGNAIHFVPKLYTEYIGIVAVAVGENFCAREVKRLSLRAL